MKLGTLDLFLAMNRMEKVLSKSEKRPYMSHIGGNRSKWSKIDNRRMAHR